MDNTVESQINFLVENSINPVLIFDKKNLMITRCNPAALDMITDPEERKLESIFSEDIIDAVLDNRYYHQSRQILRNYQDSRGEIFLSQDDNITGMMIVKWIKPTREVEISENKIIEELWYSESRFRMLFEQSPLLFQIFNSEGDLVKYNKSFEKTWRLKGEIPKKYNIFEDLSLSEDFRSHVEKAFNGEFSEIPPVKFSPGFSRENYIWMRGFIYPVKELDSLKEVVLILENITDQKKIEENFGIEASYRSAIESSISAGIAVVDITGRQTYVNEAFCKMLGWTKNELMGMYPPFIYWAPECRNEIENAFNGTIQGIAPPSGYELKFRNKNNDIIDVLVVINPLKNENGIIYAWLASVSDITKIKTVEKEIKDSLKEKEVLLREIHHRVKNNLQIISSLLNLQLNYIDDKSTQMIFKESQNRVMSMALIHQKLYVSKNQLNINLQEYISELIQHLIQSFKINKDISIDVKAENVILDNDKVVILGLILNELISNSLRYGFSGRASGKIQVHMKQTDSKYHLLVKDDGTGFPANINFKKSPTLGLQLVNTLVDQLGGKIKLKQDEGAEFIIEFHLKK